MSNADSWEFIIKNINGNPVFFSAGVIDEDMPCVNLWDGSGLLEFVYYANIRFKNSFGRELFIEDFALYQLTGLNNMYAIGGDNGIYGGDIPTKKATSSEFELLITPNPIKTDCLVRLFNDDIQSVEVFSVQGKLVYFENDLSVSEYQLNANGLPMGEYILVVNKKYMKKIIKI